MTGNSGCNPTLVMAALVAAIYALMRRRLWLVLVDPRDKREDDEYYKIRKPAVIARRR